MPVEEWNTYDYALAAIDMLPDNPEGIANFLRDQGIWGAGRGGSSCPIARWVQKWTGEKSFVGVYRVSPLGISYVGTEITMSPGVRKFIELYDQGEIAI